MRIKKNCEEGSTSRSFFTSHSGEDCLLVDAPLEAPFAKCRNHLNQLFSTTISFPQPCFFFFFPLPTIFYSKPQSGIISFHQSAGSISD